VGLLNCDGVMDSRHFLLVQVGFSVGLKGIQFGVKVIRFRKVLKNAQNGSGEAIRNGSRGRVLGGSKNALRPFKCESTTVLAYYFCHVL
jgi:hypothetical protein